MNPTEIKTTIMYRYFCICTKELQIRLLNNQYEIETIDTQLVIIFEINVDSFLLLFVRDTVYQSGR